MLETGCFDSDAVAEIVKEIIIGTTHLNIYGLCVLTLTILQYQHILCIKQKRFYEIPCVRK